MERESSVYLNPRRRTTLKVAQSNRITPTTSTIRVRGLVQLRINHTEYTVVRILQVILAADHYQTRLVTSPVRLKKMPHAATVRTTVLVVLVASLDLLPARSIRKHNDDPRRQQQRQ